VGLPRKHIAEAIAAQLIARHDVFAHVTKRELAEPCVLVDGGAVAHRPILVSARLVETVCPARRCGAPGCGEKIQDDDTYEIVWSDGFISHVEGGCIDVFVNGHPDYGCAWGPVEGLPLRGRVTGEA
jgi:hypothetical protein